jgi:hypothetical protein
VDTNDLHTAALQRRPVAGDPRRWGSVLQGSQEGRGQWCTPKLASASPCTGRPFCGCTTLSSHCMLALGQSVEDRHPEYWALWQTSLLLNSESLGEKTLEGSGVESCCEAGGYWGRGLSPLILSRSWGH